MPLIIVPETKQPTRFVRIRLDGESFLHFDECLIFGLPAAGAGRPEPANIAQRHS